MARSRILVADGEPEIRVLLRSLLSRRGFEIEEARDGVEARPVCRNGADPDLLLTDVVMPRMDGAELAEKVSALFPDARILYMPGRCDAGIIQRPVRKEGCGFIRKPLEIDRLSQAIQALPDPAGAREKGTAAAGGRVAWESGGFAGRIQPPAKEGTAPPPRRPCQPGWGLSKMRLGLQGFEGADVILFFEIAD